MSKAFSNLLKYLGKLNPTQKEKVYQWLKRYIDPASSVSGRLIDEMRETRFKEGFECPHCASEFIVRFGKYSGRQRYKCKCCLKTFNDMTNTALYRTRKSNEWIAFIECMIKGYSLRKSADIVGVTWVTLFYWRHKLLNALKQMDFDQFQGIVEVDETYFLYSEKGKRNIDRRKPRKRGGKANHRGISREQVCVLVARDRAKSTVSKVTCMGRVVKTQVEKVIGSKLHSENVLVTDAWRAYKTYAKEKGLEHYRIKSTDGKHVIKGIYHIQNVNGVHSRLKQWIDRFKGVASKYLDNYLAWFLFVDKRGHESSKQNIKDMLLSSFSYETNDTYESIRISKLIL
ncbi:IS1595 family transposase [Brevibacillus choshinensis]|uniref:IS1595 family transposase n=1 Tax=Brevibacillus choshinensis TaxID=54911 RepID=UPI002E2006A4|nr:IS1595 family transposase [Brevibacillus choshinensis]MED4750815.1 IS1595 family transposase [Brevibacillus choshinensis]